MTQQAIEIASREALGEAKVEMGMPLTLARQPERVIAEAQQVCQKLMAFVMENNLYQRVGNKKHLYIEAWSMLGRFFNVGARTKETIPYERAGHGDGWKAIAEAYDLSTGQGLATAEAICSNEEPNWCSRTKYEWRDRPGGGGREKFKAGEEPVPDFQRLSMAQTRAASKVLRLMFSSILAAGGFFKAGFSPTPAEEMVGADDAPGDRVPRKSDIKRKSAGPKLITDEERHRIFGTADDLGLTQDDVKAVVKELGFEKTSEIPKARYTEVMDKLKNLAGTKKAIAQEGVSGSNE